MRVAPGKQPECATGRQQGFTYLGMLIFVAIIGIGLLATTEVWHTAQQREKEQELLFIGDQFRRAIGLYYEHSPGGVRSYPTSLEDLLKDPRYPSTQRYLRRIYRDPVNGDTEWGVVTKPEGGIMGVYSLSEQEPLKQANFSAKDVDFIGKTKYSDWLFVFVPQEKTGKQQPRRLPAAVRRLNQGTIPK